MIAGYKFANAGALSAKLLAKKSSNAHTQSFFQLVHNMTTIIILAIIAVSAISGFLVLLEGFLNRNDEFIEVKEWHNFRNSFNQTNKGEK